MSTLTRNGRPQTKNGSRAVRSAIVAVSVLAALGFSSVKVWADTPQSEIQANLPSGTTILTAKAPVLALAVATAITNGTGGFTPAQLAAAAFQPVTVGSVQEVRKDRATSSPVVLAKAISVISGTDPAFSTKIGAMVDAVVAVNGTNGAQNLTTAAKEAVVKTALATLSDETAIANTLTVTSLDAAAKQIGEDVAGDAVLQQLPSLALTSTLQVGIEGIVGVKGRDTSNAPAEAASFVDGILTSGLPNSLTYSVFGVDILKYISANTSVDELVANKIGLHDTPTDLPNVGSALLAKYTKAVAKITQGLTGAITAVNNTESGRVTFLTNLTSLQPKDGALILQGAVYTDPYFASTFTDSVFSTVVGSSPTTKTKAALSAAATATAKGVGAILGSDGDVLTQVASVFSTYIGQGKLPVTKATTYATTLLTSAEKSTVPTTLFTQFAGFPNGGAGGKLNNGNLAVGINSAVLDDMASIVDVFAGGILTADLAAGSGSLTGRGLTTAESQVAALAAAVAKLARNELFTTANGTSVAGFIAGTLAEYIDHTFGSSFTGPTESGIFAAIKKSVQAISNTAVKADVAAQITDFAQEQLIGKIGTEETAVTDL
jgi:hypothetical protein